MLLSTLLLTQVPHIIANSKNHFTFIIKQIDQFILIFSSSRFVQTKSTKKENGTTVTITKGDTINNHAADQTDNLSNGRSPDKFTTTTHITQEQPQKWGTSMQFSEIKSLKRVHKVNEGIGTDTIIDTPGIVNPYTGEIMTVRNAIASRILDVRSGKLISSTDGSYITIEEALKRGLIDPKIAERLQSPCGIREDGQNLTLLEAIQREIFEAEQGIMDPSEKRIKVTLSSGENDGEVDEGATKSYIYTTHKEIKLKMGAVCLYDAINQGLVDERSGWIVDRNSGNKFQIDSAVKTNLLDGNVREIVDPKEDNKLTLCQALEKGIINPKLGKYVLVHEKLSFVEAKRRQFIVKPMTLKDLCDQNLIDNDGKIFSPLHQTKLTMIEAIDRGVLDSDSIKSIVDAKSGELLSLNEAVAQGIIFADNTFKDTITNETFSIPEAVRRGYITSVTQKSIFDIDGFQPPDKTDFISFNAAVAKGFISKKSNGSLVANVKSGKLIAFKDAVKSGEIKTEVFEMLERKIGVFENGLELTVLEAVFKGYIDPKTGNFIDISKNKIVPLNDAIAQNLITPEGAALLNSLLMINVTTQTTCKLVQRYVTVTTSGEQYLHTKLTYSEAIQRGLIDNQHQTFLDPETNQIIPIVQALSEGKVSPDTEDMETSPKRATLKLVRLQQDSKPEKQVFELPPDGWSLRQAIDQKLLDPIEGLFIIPGTDRLVSFEECIKLKIINPSSAVVVDPVNQRKISLTRSLEKNILDNTGKYNMNNKKIPLKDAISQNLVILEEQLVTEPSSQRLLQITKEAGKPIKIEVANIAEQHPPTYTEIKIMGEETTKYLEPIQLTTGSIYDPSSNLVILPESNEAHNLLDAIKTNKIDSNLIKVTEPSTGAQITIEEAFNKNVVDPNTGEYTDLSGRKISMSDAAKLGVLVIVGAPLALGHTIKELIYPQNQSEDPKAPKTIATTVFVKESLPLKSEEVVFSKPERPTQGTTTIITTSMTTKDKITTIPEEAPVEQLKTLPIESISLEKDPKSMSPAERTRSRITIEPKYRVAIGRAKSMSPDRGAKKVILQKLRKKIVKPKEAVEKGIIDINTAELLEKRETFTSPEGDSLNLQEAIEYKNLDGDGGKIIDPQRGDLLTVNEAISRGFFDPNGTNELLIPLNRSLSIPELFQQGLIDPTTNKVVHPETGVQLTLSEGIVCDIVDPLSTLTEITGAKVTLEEALKSGTVDENLGKVKTPKGQVDFHTAVEVEVFDKEQNKGPEKIPPAGMTFPVALKRGLVDTQKKEIVHPITKERKPLETAIEDDFIMALPYPRNLDAIEVGDALKDNLIDTKNQTFKYPKTGEIVPLAEAIEKGFLIVKQLPQSMSLTTQPVTKITATVTSVHTVTTKTIELLSGYILVNTNEIKSQSTGEIFTIEEARSKGIIVDEKETKNTTTVKDVRMSFSDAVNKGLVDLHAGTYTDPSSGSKITISEALQEGILDATEDAPSSSSPTQKSSELNIAEAFESIYDKDKNRFVDPKSPEKLLTFSEALEKEIIDPNSMIYDVKAQQPITVEQAVEKGLIDAKTGQIKDEKSGKGVDIKRAAKLGLIAIMGTLAAPVVAPVLAGAAAVKAIKNRKGDQKDKPKEDPNQIDAKKSVTNESFKTKEKAIKTTLITKTVTIKESKPVISSLAQQPSKVTIQNQDLILEQLPLGDAIAQHKIEPKICRIIYNDKELPYTVQDALQQDELTPLDTIQIIDKNQVVLVGDKPKCTITISKDITPQKLAELGFYDPKRNCFVDPHTLERITFQELVYDLEVFDPDQILVKELTKKPATYVTLDQALKRPLIDKNTGHMVDRKTGKRVPFFEAIKLKWIIHMADKPKEKYPMLTFEEIVETDNFNPDTGEVVDPNTGEQMPLIQALSSNVVDPKSVNIRDPKNMQIIPYYDAVDSKIVDFNRGIVINTATQEEIPFKDAFEEGYLLTLRRPISLVAVVEKGYYDSPSGKIKDSLTKALIPIKEAVSRGIVDDKITQIKDTKSDTIVPLDVALKNNLINPESAQILDTKSNQLIPLDTAIRYNILQTKTIIFNFLQAILMNYYVPSRGTMLNPMTGDEVTIRQAIEDKLIDPITTKIKDDQHHKIIDLKEAIETNLLDPDQGMLTSPTLTLDKAYEKGYILSTILPWSLQETLALGLYNPSSGKFEINNSAISLHQAIEDEIINPDVLTIKDPRTNDIITLNDAIIIKLVDVDDGVVIDPSNGNTRLNFNEAQDRGLIVPYKSQISLPEAIYKGFYDPKTGKFINPKNKQKLKADKAIRRGYLDPTSTLLTIDEELYTFDQAVDGGIIDTEQGVVVLSDNEKPLNFTEAFERGLLVEIRTPISLSEAVNKIYDPDSYLFLDPQTGNYVTLIEAIEINLLDPDSVHVRDTRAGVWKKLTLVDAIHNHIVDGDTGKVKDFTKGEPTEITLQQALDSGILIDNKAAISLQRAIHQGLYDESTGKILDPNTDRKITLHEAIRKFVINPLLPCYFNKKEGVVLNLADSCRVGLIDKRLGTFTNPNGDTNVPLSEALNKKFIIDIETCNFELYEIIEMQFYETVTNVFIHPATNQRCTLKEACESELVNPIKSLVKNPKTNKYVKLPEAVASKLIDDEKGNFILQNGKVISLLEAKEKGLIVTSRKLLTLEEAIKNYFYRPESGKFVDPSSGEFYDLEQSLNSYLLDPSTTAFKDPVNYNIKPLRLAITDGNIDVNKGRVLDPKTKKTYNFDKALENGLLVTLDKPLITEDYQSRSVDLTSKEPKNARECSLEDALKFELFDPKLAVVKDPQDTKFKSVDDAIKSGLLKIEKVLIFDTQVVSKIKSLIVVYDQNVTIFLREPLSFEQALECGHLDPNTGKFTDPQSTNVLTLKDSVSCGYIDPDTALIKDSNKKKLIKLPEGFRKGLIDAEKGNVLDSGTSKLYTLPSAIDSGLLTTPRRGFTLIEAVIYGIYNPVTGGFSDPFTTAPIIDRKRLSLTDAIDNNLIDPSSTVIKDPESGTVVSLLKAIEYKLVDPIAGKIEDKTENKAVDFGKAHERGLILPAEQRVSFIYLFFIF